MSFSWFCVFCALTACVRLLCTCLPCCLSQILMKAESTTMYSQFFNVVQPKKGSIHELCDAIPLHLQWLQWIHPFECQAVHYLDLVAFHFTTKSTDSDIIQKQTTHNKAPGIMLFGYIVNLVNSLNKTQYTTLCLKFKDHSTFFLTNNIFYDTYRNWSCGSLKTLDGSTTSLFLFNLSTSKELEMFSKQPGSRTLILLLLKFLRDWKEKH